MRKKLLSLLVLLMTAATGAWAQDYTITLPSVENGSVVAKVNDTPVTSAAAGATVSLVATPDAGYGLKSISGVYSETVSETFSSGANTRTGTYFSVSGSNYTYGWRIGNNGLTLTISSRSGQNLSQVVLTVGTAPNVSQRNISHLQADHGTLSATGTTQGNTITITDINSPTVTVSAPSSGNSASMWSITQAKIDGLGSVALTLTDTGDDNVKTFTMPSGNVTISAEYTKNEMTLTDGDDLSALSAYVGEQCDVTYLRSFTAGKPSTVCLPFAYTKKTGDGSFYAFSGIEKVGCEYIATMTEPGTTTLEANTPYLYLPNATGDVDFGGAYTIPENLIADSYTSGDWTFKGTFETIEWTTAPIGTYGFSAQNADGISQGEFVKVGDYVRISPMRCYLEYIGSDSQWAGVRGKNRVAAKLPETIKVRLIGADGTVTAIGSLSTTTGEMTMDGAWYSINGTRLNDTPATKGIYVRNGKKAVIK